MKKKSRFSVAFALGSAALLAALALIPALQSAAAETAHEGDFFIISSINKRNHELFLKAPTEVTELMRVNNNTQYLNSEGKPMSFADLRAGSTVYVVSTHPADGAEPLAMRVEEGPMTIAILHARFLKQ